MVIKSKNLIWYPFFKFLNIFLNPDKEGIEYKIFEKFLTSYNNWFNLNK
jgi:hypothetical protein